MESKELTITDDLFETVYNDEILSEIEGKFGGFRQHHVELTAETEGMIDLIDKLYNKKSRRGEVVMVVPNRAGKIWLHTKAFYPEGAYRLMTGGIDHEEPPTEALTREVFEETGFELDIGRCLAVITYTLIGQGIIIPFVSYAFLTKPASGYPDATDSGEAISDFKAVSVSGLHQTAQTLQTLPDRFLDWGRFRAVAHREVAAALSNSSDSQS